jgi:hypothetical protein
VPLIIPYRALFHYVPEVPKSPECYANAHPKRIDDIQEEVKELVDPFKLKNQSQDDRWKHKLDHDVESVFWLLLYWAMVTQPEGHPGEYINPIYWTAMLEDFKDRERLVLWFSSGDRPNNLTHSVYVPLWPLITSLAATLVVDSHWLPKSNVRKRPEYICEAFQHLILGFIISEHSKDFMTCRVDNSLRHVYGVVQSQALSTTQSREWDRLERE